MKKMLLSIMMLFGVSFGGFAHATDVNALNNAVEVMDGKNKYAINVNDSTLKSHFKLNDSQVEDLRDVMDSYNKSMYHMYEIKDENVKRQYFENAASYLAKGVGLVLNRKQYHDYFCLVNVTYNNRGIVF